MDYFTVGTSTQRDRSSSCETTSQWAHPHSEAEAHHVRGSTWTTSQWADPHSETEAHHVRGSTWTTSQWADPHSEADRRRR